MTKHALHSAYQSASVGNKVNVNFGKFHSVYKLFTKENEKILPVKSPANLVYDSAKKGCDLLICDIKGFIMKNFYHFSVSLRCA